MSLKQQREQLVSEILSTIRALHRHAAIDRDVLKSTAEQLEKLATRRDLFNFDEFPLPSDEHPLSTRYELQVGENQEYALYLQALLPGKTSVPHNHGTWVVVVAIEGEELNRVYRRADDGSDPGQATLEVDREIVVRPGQPALFLGDDIHSIHVVSDKPALHFHLYGRALETLTERLAFDLESGKVTRYNQTRWRPSVKV